MSRPVPSPSMNGMMGLSGKTHLPFSRVILVPLVGKGMPLKEAAKKHLRKYGSKENRTPNIKSKCRNGRRLPVMIKHLESPESPIGAAIYDCRSRHLGQTGGVAGLSRTFYGITRPHTLQSKRYFRTISRLRHRVVDNVCSRSLPGAGHSHTAMSLSAAARA